MFILVQYFQSHMFSKGDLCLWVSLSEQAKQQTLCSSINVFYLFLFSTVAPSGTPQGSS